MAQTPSETVAATAAAHTRGHPLGWLGRKIVRHPWYMIVLWVAVLLVCIVPATNVGKVITGGFSNPLPSSDESVRAQNAYSEAFPAMQSSPSSAIVLLQAPNITGSVGRNATIEITNALVRDPLLKNVSSVESLYAAYSGYLVGEVELGWGFLAPALNSVPSLPDTINATATTVWYPVATYLQNWEAIVAGEPSGTPPSNADWPAFNETRAELPAGSTESQVLGYFYNGETGVPGFNASVMGGCLTTQNATACADGAAHTALGGVLPSLYPSMENLTRAELVLGELGVENWTETFAQRGVATTLLGSEVGIAPGWLLTIWDAFPSTTPPSDGAAFAWAEGLVQQDPMDRYPLPIPAQIYSSFVNPAGSATLIVVSFNVGDDYTANGTTVTYNDDSEITHDVTTVLGGTVAYASITSYVTGGSPLDGATTYLATSALSLLLVLTIVVLLVIMLLYFRSPSAPLLAFGMIGVALVASLSVIYLVGTFVMTFNSMIESIILVFLMAIGTDYSVFLLARYREELVRGTDPKKAVETMVRWAGQSIATSGAAVMVVALALSLSGISFLTQLGTCLLIAVACALLVNLTVLPSVVVLVGPRIFWPNSGKRFARYAERRTKSIETHRDFISKAGRTSTRRPLAVIGLIVLISVPVVIVALQVPVSYDITNIGLPPSNPAQAGFAHLESAFGPSYSSSSYALVTFTTPLMVNGTPNVPEFQEVAGLAATATATPGVMNVDTLVGAGGAPLGVWLNYSALPPAVRVSLNETLGSYVGVDGKTVLFNIATNVSGYSAAAISVIDHVQQRMDSYDTAHAGVTRVLVGGAAPTTQDIQSLVNQATEEMLIGAAIGLFVLMLVILGSAFVPLLALGVIGLSILWSWAGTYFVVGIVEGEVLIFLLPLILLIMVMGLGMDYNVLLLTRVKEERTLGNRGVDAIKDAVTHAGGVITAAAVILGGAFLLLGFTSPLGLIAAIGLGIGFGVLLQAFVVQLFFTPAVLTVGKDGIWKGWRRSP